MSRTNYWQRATGARVSRRSMLRGTAVAGAGLAGAALIGCGGDEDEPEATGTASGGGSATATGTSAGGTATGTSSPAASDIKTGGTWKSTATGDPPSIDPYGNLSFLTKGYSAYPYSRLYRLNAEEVENPNLAVPTPDIAESAESQDGQHWTVKLKQGVKFHNKAPVDGRELTTEDVMFSWGRLTAPDSTNRDMVKNFTNAEAVDDYTLSFTLSGPSPTFLDTLADANILWVMPTESEGGFDATQQSIGSGPWMMEDYRPSSAFTFAKHPEYYNTGKPYMDGVELAIVPEYATSLAQFRAGNIHAQGINANDVLTVKGERPEVQWRGIQSALLSFMYFQNWTDNPDLPWADARFRQAVSMATDRDALTDLGYNVTALRDAGLDVIATWSNLIPAGFTRWWLDPQSEEQGPSAAYFEYNPDEAKKMLEASGGAGATLKYQYTANRYGSTFNSIAEACNNYLLEAGLQTQVEVQDYSSTYITNTFVGDLQGVAFGYETPFPEVGGYFARMFGDHDANHSRITPPDITALVEKQAVELDEEQRREYIHEIQRLSDQEMYYVPSQAGAGTGWTAFQPEVQGIVQTRGYGDPTEALIYRWLDV